MLRDLKGCDDGKVLVLPTNTRKKKNRNEEEKKQK